MANDKRMQAARKLRKALQIALSAVELDQDDIDEIGGVFDPFDVEAKYKKGMLCSFSGVTYICLKTTKRGPNPDADPDHWAVFGASTTEPEEPTDPGTEPEEPAGDTYDPEATYNKGDTVVHNGATYTCDKNNVRGIEPGTDDKCWKAV